MEKARLKTFSGPFAILCLTLGLLMNQSIIEYTIVSDGKITSPLYKLLIIAWQLSLIASAFYLFGKTKIQYLSFVSVSILFLFFFANWPIINNLQQHYALDCSYGPGKCFMRVLDYTIDCRSWSPSSCTRTKKGVRDVTYIADRMNFVHSQFTEQKFTVQHIDVELRDPWDLEFLPDGSILVTERGGRIVHVKNNSAKKVYQLQPTVLTETGLMGLAIDPQFSSNSYVYIMYTYRSDESDPASLMSEDHEPGRPGEQRVLNKISRLTFNKGLLTNEVVLLGGIPGSAEHSGGRLEFGPDGKLYATTGDAAQPLLSQDVSFLGGKILRLNADGTVPTDNPFIGSYVYSVGHRNPQGLAWHPVSGHLYASEHGPFRYDEINQILPGRNYGWGNYKCDKYTSKDKPPRRPDRHTLSFPVICFNRFTFAPSGMEFVSDPNSPWYRSLFVAALRGKHLHRYEFDTEKILRDEIFYVSEGQNYKMEGIGRKGMDHRIRDVEYYKGSLYVIGDSVGLVKITPA